MLTKFDELVENAIKEKVTSEGIRDAVENLVERLENNNFHQAGIAMLFECFVSYSGVAVHTKVCFYSDAGNIDRSICGSVVKCHITAAIGATNEPGSFAEKVELLNEWIRFKELKNTDNLIPAVEALLSSVPQLIKDA